MTFLLTDDSQKLSKKLREGYVKGLLKPINIQLGADVWSQIPVCKNFITGGKHTHHGMLKLQHLQNQNGKTVSVNVCSFPVGKSLF